MNEMEQLFLEYHKAAVTGLSARPGQIHDEIAADAKDIAKSCLIEFLAWRKDFRGGRLL